jgi:hypothetical protein
MNPVLAAQYTANQSTTEDCEGPLRITISTAGTISNAWVITSAGSGGADVGVYQNSSINLGGFTNTGTITATANPGWDAIGIYKFTSSIKTTLTNTGSITGTATTTGSGYGIYNYITATITTLINSNSITGSSTGSGSGYGISNDQTSSIITTLTNTGSITGTSTSGAAFGIKNSGTITTLNNSQGAGNSAGALTYGGVLPLLCRPRTYTVCHGGPQGVRRPGLDRTRSRRAGCSAGLRWLPRRHSGRWCPAGAVTQADSSVASMERTFHRTLRRRKSVANVPRHARDSRTARWGHGVDNQEWGGHQVDAVLRGYQS